MYLSGTGSGMSKGVSNLTVLGPTGGYNALIVAKITPSTQQVAYVTEIGGTGGETLGGMAVDPDGNVYLVGGTGSRDFPTTPSSYQPTGRSGGFLLELDSSGQILAYLTYLYHGRTAANALAIDK